MKQILEHRELIVVILKQQKYLSHQLSPLVVL